MRPVEALVFGIRAVLLGFGALIGLALGGILLVSGFLYVLAVLKIDLPTEGTRLAKTADQNNGIHWHVGHALQVEVALSARSRPSPATSDPAEPQMRTEKTTATLTCFRKQFAYTGKSGKTSLITEDFREGPSFVDVPFGPSARFRWDFRTLCSLISRRHAEGLAPENYNLKFLNLNLVANDGSLACGVGGRIAATTFGCPFNATVTRVEEVPMRNLMYFESYETVDRKYNLGRPLVPPSADFS